MLRGIKLHAHAVICTARAIERFNFEKFKCSNAVQECSAPQHGVDSAGHCIFDSMATLECEAFQSCHAPDTLIAVLCLVCPALRECVADLLLREGPKAPGDMRLWRRWPADGFAVDLQEHIGGFPASECSGADDAMPVFTGMAECHNVHDRERERNPGHSWNSNALPLILCVNAACGLSAHQFIKGEDKVQIAIFR